MGSGSLVPRPQPLRGHLLQTAEPAEEDLDEGFQFTVGSSRGLGEFFGALRRRGSPKKMLEDFPHLFGVVTIPGQVAVDLEARRGEAVAQGARGHVGKMVGLVHHQQSGRTHEILRALEIHHEQRVVDDHHGSLAGDAPGPYHEAHRVALADVR